MREKSEGFTLRERGNLGRGSLERELRERESAERDRKREKVQTQRHFRERDRSGR